MNYEEDRRKQLETCPALMNILRGKREQAVPRYFWQQPVTMRMLLRAFLILPTSFEISKI